MSYPTLLDYAAGEVVLRAGSTPLFIGTAQDTAAAEPKAW